MFDAVTMVVAIAKMFLAWNLFRQARQQGKRFGLTPADGVRLKARVLDGMLAS